MNNKILIVDDNGINRKYAKSVLTKVGIQVIDASSGQESLEILAQESFDLILLDIQMPGLDGFETLSRIKNSLPKVQCPILAITAFYGEDGRETFLKAGFDDFLRKPIKPDHLVKVVEGWLKGEPKLIVTKSVNNQEIIDMTVYHEIKKWARNADINDLYIEFEHETSGFFERLNFLIDENNYPEILSTLHVIKGNSGSLGINDLALQTERLEADIRTNVEINLVERVKQLEDIFVKFKEGYKQFLKI